MSIFGNLTNEGLEESTDRLGGFSPLNSDVYTGDIKAAYAGKSSGGAHSVTVLVALEGGREYRETIYITNRNGENYFLNKNDKTKKVPLPGFTTIDDLCLVTTGAPLSEQETEEKVLNIYNPESKKEEPTSVPVLTGLTGKTVTLGIQKNIENKSEKQNGNYVPIADTREINTIDKVFHAETKMTVPEARAEQESADFFEKWKEKNVGNTVDRRSIKDGQGGTKGGPPASGGEKSPRKSLFGS